jgi:cation diffusion facilitator family transporter
MDNCCADKACAVDQLREQQARILQVVLAINAVMFVVELAAGIVAGSVSLLADSLDMLGDAMVYGFSLYVVARSDLWKARAAMAKASVMAVFGLFVLGEVIYKLVTQHTPEPGTMGAVGALALAANAICFVLLWRHRTQDINMRSVWICSRNDLVANVAVLVAAALVWVTATAWPDTAVGALICILFLQSAYVVAREAGAEMKKQKTPPVQRISVAKIGIRRASK